MICFKIRIFAQRQTSSRCQVAVVWQLWFALKFVSLHKDKHRLMVYGWDQPVVICFKIRIFAQRQTSLCNQVRQQVPLWFALKFVSLHKDKHQDDDLTELATVVICFKIRIFAQRQTSIIQQVYQDLLLWFALKFVSLHKDKHHLFRKHEGNQVVICFKIRIFAQRQTSKYES